MDEPARVALLTGGARRIGAEIARTLHASGWSLLLHHRRSAAEAASLAAELNSRRAHSVALAQAELAQTEVLPGLVAAAIEQFGRLDALVHNASSFYPTPLGSIDEAQWDELFASNAKAPLFLAQAAAAHLRASRGAIVHIVDVYAERPLPRYPVYCMAKAALVCLTRALARELGPEVRVNGIAPGNIIWSDNMEKAETPAMVLERTCLQRQGEPSDIARTVRFLLEDAPYVTGQILAVDGGRNLYI